MVAHFFGRFDVRFDDVRVDTRLGCGARMLLAYLLMHAGATLRREQIATRLWPAFEVKTARSVLRRHLAAIRRALPRAAQPFLHGNATSVGWSGAAWVDARAFEALCTSDETLEDAIELYAGDFAPTLCDAWATGVRQRSRARASATLDELMTRSAARYDLRRALRYGEALLRLDPWREDVLCDVMLYRYRAGNRAGSLWAYRVFCTQLERDFGVAPMPMTTRCYESIRAGMPFGSASGPLTKATTRPTVLRTQTRVGAIQLLR
ncbi:MAG: hypothetical protein NVSMB59_04780 [Vulcanimicrobiaceae bacterium]